MISNSIINNYSNALFELLSEKNCKKNIEQLKFLLEVFNKEPIFFDYLSSIFYSKDERKEIVQKIFSHKINQYLLNFIFMLIDRNIFNDSKYIINKTIVLLNRKNKIKFALIETAFELDQKQINKIVRALKNKYKKEIDYKVVINPSLIGGIKISIESDIIDGSIKTKLENIKSNFVKM